MGPSDKISFDDDIMGGMATMGGDDIVGIETAGNDDDNNDNHNGDFIIEDDEDSVVTPMYVDENDIIEDIGVTLGNDVDFDNDEDVVTAEGTDEDIIVGVETAGNDNLMVDTDSDDENEIIDDVNTVQ